MATRAALWLHDEEGKKLLSLYKHWDGYPEDPGLGSRIYNVVSGKKIVNGYDLYDSKLDTANGTDDLAASLACELKKSVLGVGDVYLIPEAWDDRKHVDAQFCYLLTFVKEEGVLIPHIRVEDCEKPVYEGTVDGMAKAFKYDPENRECTGAAEDRKCRKVLRNLDRVPWTELREIVREWADNEDMERSSFLAASLEKLEKATLPANDDYEDSKYERVVKYRLETLEPENLDQIMWRFSAVRGAAARAGQDIGLDAFLQQTGVIGELPETGPDAEKLESGLKPGA